MPAFTLESAVHPTKVLKDYDWFSINILTDIDGEWVPVVGYATDSEEVVAVASAELLGILVPGREYKHGEEVPVQCIFQSKFEGDLVIHRSPKVPVSFKVSEKHGGLFFQLPGSALSWGCKLTVAKHSLSQEKFAVLRFGSRLGDCVAVPIERDV